MSEQTKLSVITEDGGNDAAKPVGTMMTKVSKVVGALHVPGQTQREVKAQVETAFNPENGKGKATDLQQRAWLRFVQEQTIQQINMEAVMARAIAGVTAAADPEAVDEDWIAQFFGKCRTVSNEAMRDLWAKVLAGEVNRPGTYSKRLLNLLGELDRKDIEAFTTLCSFSIYSLASPVILYKSSKVAVSYNPGLYVKHGLDLGLLNHLEAIGLIAFDVKSEYTKPAAPVRYFGQSLNINPKGQLAVGNAAFSKPGWELARIMTPREIPEFFDYVKRMWKGSTVEEPAETEVKEKPAPRLK